MVCVLGPNSPAPKNSKSAHKFLCKSFSSTRINRWMAVVSQLSVYVQRNKIHHSCWIRPPSEPELMHDSQLLKRHDVFHHGASMGDSSSQLHCPPLTNTAIAARRRLTFVCYISSMQPQTWIQQISIRGCAGHVYTPNKSVFTAAAWLTPFTPSPRHNGTTRRLPPPHVHFPYSQRVLESH